MSKTKEIELILDEDDRAYLASLQPSAREVALRIMKSGKRRTAEEVWASGEPGIIGDVEEFIRVAKSAWN